jgi:hypothetical protein
MAKNTKPNIVPDKENASKKGDIGKNKIVGVLNTIVVRAKTNGEHKGYTIDMKLTTNDASNVIFKLERFVKSLVEIEINTKQPELLK